MATARSTPEQEQAISRNLGSRALGGISAAANVLDLPGSMVRDVIALRNPLDQLMSPTTDDGRITGRELLQQYGLAGKDKTWTNFATGMGAELLLDPTTYFGIGLLGRGGNAAKAIGVMPEAVNAARQKAFMAGIKNGVIDDATRAAAEKIGRHEAAATTTLKDVMTHVSNTQRAPEAFKQLEEYARKSHNMSGAGFLNTYGDSPLGSVLGSQLPFTGVANPVVNSATLAAARGLDTASRVVGDSAIGRTAKMLFHAPSGGAFRAADQTVNAALHERMKPAGAAARNAQYQFITDLDDLHDAWRSASKVADNDPMIEASKKALREWVNLTGELKDFDAAKARGMIGGAASSPHFDTLAQRVSDTAQKHRNVMDELRNDLVDSGVNVGEIADTDAAQYWTRHITATSLRDKIDQYRKLAMKGGNLGARNEVLAPIPKHVVEDVVKNFQGDAPGIMAKYGEFLQPFDDGTGVGSVDVHADLLSKAAGMFPKGVVGGFLAGGRPLYDDAISALGTYHNKMQRARASRDTIFDSYKQNIKTAGEVASNPGDYIPVFQSTIDPSTGQKVIRSAFKTAGFAEPEYAAARFAKEKGYAPDELETLFVPKTIVDAVNASHKVVNRPEYDNILRTVAQGVTQHIKDNLTLLFPSFHGRNFGSGMIGMNALLADVIHTPEQASGYVKASGKAIDMLKNPKADAARMEELFTHNIANYGKATGDVGTKQANAAGSLTPGSPLDWAASKESAKDFVKANQWAGSTPSVPNMGGVGPVVKSGMEAIASAADKARVPYHAAMNTGAKTAANAEFVNRVSLYNYLRDTLGLSPEQAAQKVHDIHVNYSDVTPFERDLKLAVPFYTFTRKMAEQVGNNLVQRPGGATATAIKLSNRSRGPDELTPDYVAETSSIPLGRAKDGTASYITGFGMPWEDPLSFLGKGVRGAGMEALSRLNPLVKGPLEYSTGQTFFQSSPDGGRPLGDADPLLGRLIANVTGSKDAYRLPQAVEVAIANSPASRYLSTARQLTDTRKDVLSKIANFTTGVRITDVSPASQDAILRERVQSALREAGGRSFVRSYIPENRLASMSPQERDQAMEYQGLLNTLADRAKDRKQAAVKPR